MDGFVARFRGIHSLLGFAVLLLSITITAAEQQSDEVTPQVQQLYAQAKAAQQGEQTSVAIEKYRAILKLSPHLAAAYNNLGMLYFNEHDYINAAHVLQRALELHPDLPTASAMLGMSYFQLGQDQKAEPILEAAHRANPNDDKLEMVLAHSLMNLKKFSEGASYLNHYLERNPKDQQAWYMLGKAYLQLSEDSLKKINEIDPNSVVAHEISGEIDESMHNYDVALVEYKKAIELAPRQPGTHMHMAGAYWHLGKWESAETEFKAELENDPNNCIARWQLGNAMLEANDSNEDALGELNHAIDRCPGLMQARVDRARALIRLGKHVEGLPDLLLAEKESPREPSIHFLLGAIYRAQGKTPEAQKEMQTYAQLQREASAAVADQANDASSIKSAAH